MVPSIPNSLSLSSNLEKLAVMLLGDDELVDVLLSLGLVRLKRAGQTGRHASRPRLGLVLLQQLSAFHMYVY